MAERILSEEKASYPAFPLSPVIKVVSGGCNLRCPYCFYDGHQPEIRVMDKSTLETVMQKLILASPQRITFIWHGGEPTIPGVDYYRELVGLQKKLTLPNQKVFNRIQTNATLINTDWINFFKESGWGIGISLDGPEQFHDLARVNTNGKGTFRRVMQTVEMLKDSNIRFGAIVVVNSKTVEHPDEIFEFMYQNHIPFSANPCSARPNDPEEVHDLAISPMRYAKFMARLFELWIDRDDPAYRIRPLEDITKSLLGGQSGYCKFRAECKRYITIDSNGDVYPCDEFLESKYVLGNLVRQDVDEIFESEQFDNYYKGRDTVVAGCGDCKWLEVCKGGCMREWDGDKSLSNPNDREFCQARQYLFSTINDTIKKMKTEGGEKIV